MSSGVRFKEDYSGDDDLAVFIQTLVKKGAIEALKPYQAREAVEGSRFRYASSETLVLGLVIRSSTGRSLSDYISEKLWRPMGAESDASWVIDPTGIEWSFAKFNAVLRDYGRLGNLLAHDGNLHGHQILPFDYLKEATDWHNQPQAFRAGYATPYLGYGYQFWLFPGNTRRFALMGIFGQILYVDPTLKLVIVQTAVAKQPSSMEMLLEFEALVTGITASCERVSCSTPTP